MPVATQADVRRFIKENGPYRLECSGGCFAQLDGVRKVPKGWTGVRRVRSLKESLSTYDDEGDPDPPPGYSVLDWETHSGLCPDCSKAEAEQERKEKRRKPAKK